MHMTVYEKLIHVYSRDWENCALIVQYTCRLPDCENQAAISDNAEKGIEDEDDLQNDYDGHN